MTSKFWIKVLTFFGKHKDGFIVLFGVIAGGWILVTYLFTPSPATNTIKTVPTIAMTDNGNNLSNTDNESTKKSLSVEAVTESPSVLLGDISNSNVIIGNNSSIRKNAEELEKQPFEHAYAFDGSGSYKTVFNKETIPFYKRKSLLKDIELVEVSELVKWFFQRDRISSTYFSYQGPSADFDNNVYAGVYAQVEKKVSYVIKNGELELAKWGVYMHPCDHFFCEGSQAVKGSNIFVAIKSPILQSEYEDPINVGINYFAGVSSQIRRTCPVNASVSSNIDIEDLTQIGNYRNENGPIVLVYFWGGAGKQQYTIYIVYLPELFKSAMDRIWPNELEHMNRTLQYCGDYVLESAD